MGARRHVLETDGNINEPTLGAPFLLTEFFNREPREPREKNEEFEQKQTKGTKPNRNLNRPAGGDKPREQKQKMKDFRTRRAARRVFAARPGWPKGGFVALLRGLSPGWDCEARRPGLNQGCGRFAREPDASFKMTAKYVIMRD
jgi:hypothetical protein